MRKKYRQMFSPLKMRSLNCALKCALIALNSRMYGFFSSGTQGYPLQGGMQQLQQQGQLGTHHLAGMPPSGQHQGMAGERQAILSVVVVSVLVSVARLALISRCILRQYWALVSARTPCTCRYAAPRRLA